MNPYPTLRNSGDRGDLIYALSILKKIGGGNLVVCERPFTRKVDWYHDLKPLCESQEYVFEYRWELPNEIVTYETSTFRPPRRNCTLIESMARHVGLWPINTAEPWLFIDPIPNDRVYVCLSERYQNELFPWQEIADFYRDRITFVGLPREHELFCQRFGHVAYQPVRDYLELARYLAGCFLYVGNQTSITAIAEGLKIRRLICVCCWTPDTLCFGGDVQYCYDGCCTLPNDRGESRIIGPKPKRLADRMNGIPGGFRFSKDGKDFVAGNWNALIQRVRKVFPTIDEDEVDAQIASTLGRPFVALPSMDFHLVREQLKLAGKL